MDNPRRYGKAPFRTAVIHGGPGAAGEMRPVAEALAGDYGILEPLQTAVTVDGQVRELKVLLEQGGATPPVLLVGHSWGAWLAWIFAARHPELVRKLVLVGSGPFESRYAEGIMKTRLARLDERERREARRLLAELNEQKNGGFDTLARFGRLISKADSYDPLPGGGGAEEGGGQDVYNGVWPEADSLRRSGRLLRLGETIRCPVLAIHGDYDPHPAAGVEEPLARVIGDFKFIRLKGCGHTPWLERQAIGAFYEILRKELAAGA